MTKQKADLSLKPAAGYLLIEPEQAVKETSSGIVLPESHDEKPQRGKVLAVGEKEVLDSGKIRQAPCKVGETVVYKKWGGNEYQVEGKELLFIKFEDILAIIGGR